MADPEGVITCCGGCGRQLTAGELWGDPCDQNPGGCPGLLNHSEDAIEVEIRRLAAVKAARTSRTVVEGTPTVQAL